jgi:subtilisin family serine protease
MIRTSLLFVFLFCASTFHAQETTLYRLILTDKGVSTYSINKPEEFLSQKSIDRRNRQGFPIDETDLPLSPDYFNALIDAGASIQTHSKWLKTIVVSVSDESIIDSVRKLSFVADSYPVFKGYTPTGIEKKEVQEELKAATSLANPDFDDYGDGFIQISLNNGHLLHKEGYRGNGMTIAVMDAGFTNADKLNDYFDQSKILGVKNFTHEKENPLQSTLDHGTKVLSCMLSNKPQEMIGTAPDAEYYLFKTEVNGSEFPVEEDYWVAGIEYADSLGVDVISTSLGYFTFNDSGMNHTQAQLDGQTIPASRAAAMAAYKGMILCNSAGNEGNKDWGKIIFPSDAENILTIGGIMSDSIRSGFSSLGNTADGRVKPDIMALASYVMLVGGNGKGQGSGTSFACPIISGLTASLWQALPELNSLELMDLIRKTANSYQTPDNEYGYGIADFFKAYLEGSSVSAIPSLDTPDYFLFAPNRICFRDNDSSKARLSVYTCMGIKVLETDVSSTCVDIHHLNKGIYIARFQDGNKQYIRKFIKQ